MNGRSATESKLVIQLCLVKVDRSQNDLTVYHTKSTTTCDYMYVQLTYIMYDPCLHAFSQCVCVVIRLSLVYKASAQSLCAVSGLPTFSAKWRTLRAHGGVRRHATRMNAHAGRAAAAAFYVSVCMLSPSRSDMFCRVKTSTHLRAFDSYIVDSKARSWVHILTLQKHVGTAFRQHIDTYMPLRF